MNEQLKKREHELAVSMEAHEKEWTAAREEVECEASLLKQQMEALQEERFSMQQKEHELEMERREIHAIKLRLESEAAAHIQVSVSVFSQCKESGFSISIGERKRSQGLGDASREERKGVRGNETRRDL